MEKSLDALFPLDEELEKKLQEFATLPNYKELLFAHLGPELNKIFEKKKNNIAIKNFLDAAQYEYGFFNQKKDISKAFSLYKKYADSNDYFCMYKMHVIYLCEYEKFGVPRNRILEKLYLLKCFAYLPNYIMNYEDKLFHKIDVTFECASILDTEDETTEKHKNFLELLDSKREEYNLTENDINLMKGVLTCYFHTEQEEDYLLSFCELKSIQPSNNCDYAYFEAMNKCIFFKDYLNIENSISDEEIEKFYMEILDKKVYQYYSDYGNYLLDKGDTITEKIINIFKVSMENGNDYSRFRYYQCLLSFYDFNEYLNDYNKTVIVLNSLVDEVACECLSITQFILFVGILIKQSKFADKIIANYLKYVKEINEYISYLLQPENYDFMKENFKHDIDLVWRIKGFIYYFGFKNIEVQSMEKAIEHFEKSSSLSERNFLKKENEYFIYRAKQILNKAKKISDQEIHEAKVKLGKVCFDNKFNTKYNLFDCFILGKIYWEGIGVKRDESIALMIFRKTIAKKLCNGIIDAKIKSQIKDFLKSHDHDIVLQYKEKVCSICYDKPPNTVICPCKHSFCSTCVEKFEENAKCPICRGEILCIC